MLTPTKIAVGLTHYSKKVCLENKQIKQNKIIKISTTQPAPT